MKLGNKELHLSNVNVRFLTLVFEQRHQPDLDRLVRHRNAVLHRRHVHRVTVRSQTRPLHRRSLDLHRRLALLPLNSAIPKRLFWARSLVLDESGWTGSDGYGESLYCLCADENKSSLVQGWTENHCNDHPQLVKSGWYCIGTSSDSTFCSGTMMKSAKV